MNEHKRNAIFRKTGVDPEATAKKVEEWGLYDLNNKRWVDGVHGSYRFCKGMKNKMERESKFVNLKIIPFCS